MMVRVPDSRQDSQAEAAAWLARLHDSEVDERTQAAFHAWCKADPRHADAFERATALWDLSGGLAGSIERTGSSRAVPPLGRRAVLAGGAAALAAGFFVWRRAEASVYITAVGEQRRLSLPDESHVLLDTDSEIRLRFGDKEREVVLSRGQASFSIAKDARPFVIATASCRVAADVASIDVRCDPGSVRVTLLEGTAAVETEASHGGEMRLAPGQRLTTASSAAQIDMPDLPSVTGWTNGRLVFHAETLAQAVAEMNRYSRIKTAVAGEVADLRISGSYRTDDSAAFVQSVASLLSLRATRQGDRVVLGR